MAAIKPIEARSVHQIQSGQVIVDLCSVVKELVENSLDAGATAVEVRFKNNGLDSIEVQDNGCGISPSNYESLALKHYTSKLASYDDLSSLQTFGFRGEALSSLCALSTFYAVTATANEAPKGKRLDFEPSGKLRSATVVAAQKGTTAVVEGLFEQLPVRRKELAKNIKKEYGKVLGLLHAYACIGTNVKLTVKSSMSKGKNPTVFATRGNPTTRENIANVYGAKTLSALVPLDLQLEFQGSSSQKRGVNDIDNKLIVRGHVSRPVFGEGRQTPDRQMFFVNGRPCGLPQISKAFNEVYKSFNVSQSPFIFADLRLDTNAYDVNVSPDKRTILLHDSAALVESLKTSLTELFDKQDQTVPHSQLQTPRPTPFKQLTITRESTADSISSDVSGPMPRATMDHSRKGELGERNSFLKDLSKRQTKTPQGSETQVPQVAGTQNNVKPANVLEETTNAENGDENDDISEIAAADQTSDRRREGSTEDIRLRDFNMRIAEQQPRADYRVPKATPDGNQPVDDFAATLSMAHPVNAVQNAFDRMRPSRPAAEIATITFGNKTITTVVGSQPHTTKPTITDPAMKNSKNKSAAPVPTQAFTQRLKDFTASGTSAARPSTETNVKEDAVPRDEELSSDADDASSENQSLSELEGEDECMEEDSMKNNCVDPAFSPEEESLGNDTGQDIGETEKAHEDTTVAELIRTAEERAASLNVNNVKRANKALRGGSSKDSLAGFQIRLATSVEQVREASDCWYRMVGDLSQGRSMPPEESDSGTMGNEEDHLALTVSKNDFFKMHIVGQFNRGFVLTVRTPSNAKKATSASRCADDLFIVDQHASDEKYNFERLQVETVVAHQRLVRPKQLDLTAVEEEILMENLSALEKNGFIVTVDTSGNNAIGQRCNLISLPLSKEVIFGIEDLEELLHLLSESPGSGQSSITPRPSKVRKMFAMRACRSSIMIGKTLTARNMQSVISHMGEIDKPWNCPHGRPTMRHLTALNALETWGEADGVAEKPMGLGRGRNTWNEYIQ